MNKLIILLGIASLTVNAQDGYDSYIYEDFGNIDYIPEVLTATRLKQPKAETEKIYSPFLANYKL